MIPKGKKRPRTAGTSLFQELIRSQAFSLVIDFVVIVNVLVVGLALDLEDSAPTIFSVMRHVVLGLYVVEILLQFAAEGMRYLLFRPFNIYEFTLVVLAIVDVWILQQTTWMWAASIGRSIRLGRIWKVAEGFPVLHDLWLVLTGLARAGKALVWLAVLVTVVLYACGSSLRGLMGPDANAGPQTDCLSPNMECINKDEFFGSVSRAALTLLQLATLDNWASHVVRPLATTSPFQATVLVIFVLSTAYALLSVAVGLLVYSTVALARTHAGHADHQHQLDTKDSIRLMTKHLRSSLLIEDRTTIDMKELTDAMGNPNFAQAFKALELPVDNISDLFMHLDTSQKGEITLETFESGLIKMKSSSSRFDVAILTATVGGAASFVHGLENRTDTALKDLRKARTKLRHAFEDLRELAAQEVDQVPEVRLRHEGRIHNSKEDEHPVQKPRYTG